MARRSTKDQNDVIDNITDEIIDAIAQHARKIDRESAFIQVACILRDHGEEMWQGMQRDEAAIGRRVSSGNAELLELCESILQALENQRKHIRIASYCSASIEGSLDRLRAGLAPSGKKSKRTKE